MRKLCRIPFHLIAGNETTREGGGGRTEGGGEMRKGRKGKTEMGTNAFSSLPYVINTRTEEENLPFKGEGLELLLLQAVGGGAISP